MLASQPNLNPIDSSIHNISLAYFRRYLQIPDLEVKAVNSKHPILGHWMSLNIISGPEIAIFFKIHFQSEIVRKLASAALKRKPETIQFDQVCDYMEELCNVIAGKITRYFHSQQINLGISLPLSTRGFDEIFFQLDVHKNQYVQRMHIFNSNINLFYSFSREILNPVALQQFQVCTLEEAENGKNEIEFL